MARSRGLVRHVSVIEGDRAGYDIRSFFPGWPPEDHTANEQVEVVAELAQSSLDTLGLKPGMIKSLNREAETPEQQKVLAKERIKGNAGEAGIS